MSAIINQIKSFLEKKATQKLGPQMMANTQNAPATKLGGVVYGEIAGQGQYPNITPQQLKTDARNVISVITNRQKSGDVNSYGGPTLTGVLNKPNQFQSTNGKLYKNYINDVIGSGLGEEAKAKIVKEIVKEWQQAIRSKNGWQDTTGGAKNFTTDTLTGRVIPK
jgi:hypothetical protein